ncbi:unnamed protein product [Symbiodinium sp. CCMP2456]|nr:unnamed protein product [Symbiodinium sp. CCMP2456]
MSKRILVFGATGKQGGAVIRETLSAFGSTATVYAVTRSSTSPAAQKLEQQGVKLVIGDMEDSSPDSPLKAAIAEAKPTHVFLMSNEKAAMFSKGSGCSQELAAANRMLDFLEASGTVEYVVMSSVAGCHQGAQYSMPNFKVKEDIEAALQSRSSLKWTVLRLVTLMDNFVDKEYGGVTKTSVTGLASNSTMEMWYVSCRDLGVAAATCFAKPDFVGKTINLASQKLSGEEIASVYAKVIKTDAKVKYTPIMGPCLMSMGFLMPDFVAMHRYWEKVGYPIGESDQEAFKALVPKPWTIEDYFTSLGDRIPM